MSRIVKIFIKLNGNCFLCCISNIYNCIYCDHFSFISGKGSRRTWPKREIKDDIELLSLEYSKQERKDTAPTEPNIVKNLEGMFGKYLP